MQINTGQTTFAQIHQTFKELEGTKKEGQELRFQNKAGSDELYVHGGKASNLFGGKERAQKKEDAVLAIKTAIDTQTGVPGTGERVFQKLGLGDRVKVSDLKEIEKSITGARNEVAKELSLAKGPQLKGQHYVATKDRFFQQMGNLPSVLNTNHPLARENMGTDHFRATVPDPVKLSGLTKVESNRLQATTPQESAGVIKAMFREPVAPFEKLANLAKSVALKDAVGYYTSHNTPSKTDVPRDSVNPLLHRSAAEHLKYEIDNSLTRQEKAALKERIDFIVEAAPIMLDKVGKISNTPTDQDIQDKLWMKSLAVSFNLFYGGEMPDITNAIGGNAVQASFLAKDLVTALAVHRDVIFA